MAPDTTALWSCQELFSCLTRRAQRAKGQKIMKQIVVSTVMRHEVVTARPEMSLYEAAASTYEHGINGLPVVAAARRGVGMLGSKDIVRVPFRSGDEVDISIATALPRLAAYLRDLRVRDVMAVRLLCVRPDDTLSVVVSLLFNHGVHPIPVVDDDRRLVGVVGRADVLGVLLSTDRFQSGAALRGRG
jgi:CBS domain-containing membrane protein